MALDNIHVEQTAMTTAVSRSSDVQTSIMDYEKQLTGIADMVKAVISSDLGINSQDAGSISEGTNTANNVSVAADDDAYTLINAINGH
jgi:hypothetical protein